MTPKGDPVARSYRVRIALPADTALKIGMTAETNVITKESPNALLVPATALEGDSLWVARDGRLVRIPVRTGIKGRDRIEIVSGIVERGRRCRRSARRAEAGREGANEVCLDAGRWRRRFRRSSMNLTMSIAASHLLSRKRQTIVSLLGITLGVAFFLAVSAMMSGSEKDFIKRLCR